jgi:hypothetical protein
MHPRPTRRGAWLDYPEDTDLPIVEGTPIRLQVDHLPGDRTPKPLWLWTSRPNATTQQADQAWQAFLRRFDAGTDVRGSENGRIGAGEETGESASGQSLAAGREDASSRRCDMMPV